MELTVSVAGSLATLTVPSRGADVADALTAARAELPGTVRLALLRIGGAADHDVDPPVAASLDTDDDAVLARWQRAFDWYSSPALVSVAAVTGEVADERLRLALGADLRVLSEEARLIFRPPGSASRIDHARLVTLAGVARANELCLAGATLDASAALAAGLASIVAPRADLEDALARLCTSLVATDRGAAAEVKALLLNAVTGPGSGDGAAERDALRRLRNARLGVERED
jgi:enoyl-CoA hydratase/carnithine racemase